MNVLDQVFHRVEALGSSATEAQQEALTVFILENVPRDDWESAGMLALDAGVPGIYTEISMRLGECGWR